MPSVKVYDQTNQVIFLDFKSNEIMDSQGVHVSLFFLPVLGFNSVFALFHSLFFLPVLGFNYVSALFHSLSVVH